jgi:hypothetical protein
MLNKLQAIQSILNVALSELGTLAGERVDNILSNLNASLKIPGMITASGTIVSIANTTYVLPNGKKESLIWDGIDLGGLLGSANFTASSVSGDVQPFVVPVIADGEFCKAGFEIRSDKKIYVIFGTVAASLGLASFPAFSAMSMPLGYVVLKGGPSGLLTIDNADTYQFFSFPSSTKQHASLTDRDAAGSHPATAISLDTAGFSGELNATESNEQLAISRMEKYGSVFPWASGNSYRVSNVVVHRNIVWKCKTAHISGATFVESNWECLESPKQESFTVPNGGQSVFTLTALQVPEATLRLQVFVNGVRQIQNLHYTINSATEIEFTEELIEDAEVLFFVA